jgi:hypothetical protein
MSGRSLATRAAGAVLAALIASGCGNTDGASAPGGPSGADSARKDSPREALGKPDVVVSPAEWRAAFKKDSAAARARYKGKVIEMSGTVDSARPDPYGLCGYISLEVPNDLVGVRCVLADKKPWRKVSPGSKVKVRGMSSDVIAGDLKPCEIVEAGPNPGVVITARELARLFAADRREAVKKYDEKWAYVKGEVAEKASTEHCAVLLRLKGEAGIGLTCCFGKPAGYRAGLDGVRVGSQVDVFGRLQVSPGPREKEISFIMCFLTDAK